MSFRARSLSTTFLTGIASAAFLTPVTATAGDLTKKPSVVAPATFWPAVDGINWKVEGLGGSLAQRSIYGGQGSVTVPLASQYGLQIDGAAGSFDNKGFGIVGGHFFWRNPAQGLLGIYASHTHWNEFGGLGVSQVAGEAEAYFGAFTLQGIAGVETGNSKSGIVGALIQTYNVETRFFDKINLAYYLNDNLKVFIGHRYQGGEHALALGGEWAFRLNGPTMGALFIEGRIGENDFQGIWGGVRFYSGEKDKTLIQRHRQDDPIGWMPDTLFSIVNTLKTLPLPLVAAGVVPDGDGDGDGDGGD